VSDRIAVRLVAALKGLGIEPTLETFAQRKAIQKLVYLLEVFGVDLNFRFGWYLHGPYSSSVTHVLYDNADVLKTAADQSALSGDERAKIAELRSFLGDDLQSPDSLELLVSMHFLLSAAKKSGYNAKDALDTLRKLKPGFSEQQVQNAYQKISPLS
jgi:hypothetical protein